MTSIGSEYWSESEESSGPDSEPASLPVDVVDPEIPPSEEESDVVVSAGSSRV